MKRLLRSCIALWGVGLAGIWIARVVLMLEPHTPLCRWTAGAWMLGGIGYLGFGCAFLIGSAERAGAPPTSKGPIEPRLADLRPYSPRLPTSPRAR